MNELCIQYQSVNSAFSKQAQHYDVDDLANPVLQAWRRQVYNHVKKYLKPNSKILELNAGTGIDAVYFTKLGHEVHATDLSDGMINNIKAKANDPQLHGRLSFQQCSYENLKSVEGRFDYIFSNFGGLNCTNDLYKVTQHFSSLLTDRGTITLVIMPPLCIWEILTVLRGNQNAFRRLNRNGSKSQLEGEFFQTYYYSLNEIKKALGKNFALLQSEGLGVLSPPPSSKLSNRDSSIKIILDFLDRRVRNHFPFNRWADHLIVTFRYKGP